MPRRSLALVDAASAPACAGHVELVCDAEHLSRVVQQGILEATVSLAIATADLKAMLVPPAPGRSMRGSAPSVIEHLARLAARGVEVRVLHAGVPSAAVRRRLRRALPAGLTIRRCPRVHAKAVIVDATAMYLGSANVTGAGLGAKGPHRRNFEWGVWTRTPALIDGVLQQFNLLWEATHCAACQRRDICPLPLEEPQLATRAAQPRSAQRRRPSASGPGRRSRRESDPPIDPKPAWTNAR